MGPILLLLVSIIVALPTVAEKAVPFLSGRVVDEAHMVPEEVGARVEQKLKALEEATGAQVAVLTVESLEGEPLEAYSIRVAQTWKLGKKGVDNGVLLMIAKQDRKMRIEVGYGLEEKLTDLRSRRILDEVIRPYFRAGQFGRGVEAGVEAIIGTIHGKEVTPAAPSVPSSSAGSMPLAGRLIGGGFFLLVVGVFSLLAVFSSGFMGWFLYVFLMPFHLAFPMGFLSPKGGIAWFAGWVIAFPILKLWLAKTAGGKQFLKRHPGLKSFASSGGGRSSGGSGGSWSFSSGGSSFSGGGGSFGGGGASSGW